MTKNNIYMENFEIIDLSISNINDVISNSEIKKIPIRNNIFKLILQSQNNKNIFFTTGWIDINDLKIIKYDYNYFTSYKLIINNDNLCNIIDDLIANILDKIENKTYVCNFGIKYDNNYKRDIYFTLSKKNIDLFYNGSVLTIKNINPADLNLILKDNKVKLIFVPVIIQSLNGIISIKDKIIDIFTLYNNKMKNITQINNMINRYDQFKILNSVLNNTEEIITNSNKIILDILKNK